LNLSAFILAAGLGERLLPITRHIPKPLLPLVGKPILESVLKRITDIPIHNIGINLHHKKHLIEDWVKHSEYSNDITLFCEDPILGTGGALKNADGFLRKGPFLVHNSDIISDIDLSKLIETHILSGNIATLAVHNHPEFNRLEIDASGLLTGFISCRKWLIDGWRPVAFTGIAVYRPEFLTFLPQGNSSGVDAWFNAMSAGHRIGTMDVTGCYWTDAGTPASYARSVIHALRENGENVFIHPSVEGCSDAELDGYISIEKDNAIKQGISLKNCISLPGTSVGETSCDDSPEECLLTLFWGAPDRPKPKRSFENCILGPDFTVQLSESDFSADEDNARFLIGTGGSDRTYHRVQEDSRSAVLMECPKDDPDFQRHIEYTTFFRKYAVPVPELIKAEAHAKRGLFEDFGDISLYSWLKCRRSGEQIEDMYRRVLDILTVIQTAATRHADECPLLQDRLFDYEHLRWETRYFLERFVVGLRNTQLTDTLTLESEFHRLASLVDSFPKTIVHRDFQSQNIMVARGGIPGILDYQGARMGPPAYDVVSLLWDPYTRLDEHVRESLLEYYLRRVSNLSSFGRDFRDTLLPCRLQRHMQALGAYGFLSSVKGKRYYLKYVPEGLRLLREDVELAKNDYPGLCELVTAT
jgi:NDP-sugar pyrophosphorylase family protein/aminoglycoside/choline kinase family phosphotransferase